MVAFYYETPNNNNRGLIPKMLAELMARIGYI